ncbi:MAG: NYN domain-containing protein [Rhodocyclaceae bacterium]|nr:NYN domain-containing protein [Rhodocyclaceae bacterium]
MGTSPDTLSMAVFCDFENVALGVRDAKYEKFDIKPVLERLLLKGSIVVKKAYCDWERYKGFKATMHEANFELIEIPHVRQSGKNSADIRLVVDALDLCYTKSHVNTFVIVSGDSDFSPLVSKLRENAKQVIGVGVKQSTSDLLIANCDEFIFYDDLVRESQRKAARRDPRDNPAQPKLHPEELEMRRSKAIELAVETLEALTAERGDTGKIWASVLKEAIKRRKPDFNESYFGFRAFGNLLEEAQSRGLLEVARDERANTFVQRTSASVSTLETAAIESEPVTAHDTAADAGQRSAAGRRNGRRGRGRGHAEEGMEAEAGVRPDTPAEPAPVATEAPSPAPEPVAAGAPEVTPADEPKPKAARSRRTASKRSPKAGEAAAPADGPATTPATEAKSTAAETTAGPQSEPAPKPARKTKPKSEAKPRARRPRKTAGKASETPSTD